MLVILACLCFLIAAAPGIALMLDGEWKLAAILYGAAALCLAGLWTGLWLLGVR